MNETDYNARLYEKMKADWQEDGVKVSKGAKSLSILEPVEYAKKDGSTGIAYNVKKVFDVSQTNGRRPAAPTLDRDPRKLVAVMLDTAPIDVATVEELPSPNCDEFLYLGGNEQRQSGALPLRQLQKRQRKLSDTLYPQCSAGKDRAGSYQQLGGLR